MLLLEELLRAKNAAEGGVEVGLDAADREPTIVAAAVGVVPGPGAGKEAFARTHRHARGEQSGHRARCEREHTVAHTHVHVLAATGVPSREQRSADREGGEEAAAGEVRQQVRGNGGR